MLTPDKLGLPPKFTSWRKGQLPSVVMIDRSKEYCFLLDAPTGTRGARMLQVFSAPLSGQKGACE